MPIIDKCVIRFGNHNWSIAEKKQTCHCCQNSMFTNDNSAHLSQ